MPRQPSIPKYRLHSQSGQAVVTLSDGLGGRRDVLLGRYGTAESRREYARVVGEWEAAGRRLPPANGTAPADLTVNELILAYIRHVDQHYRLPDGSPTGEVREYRLALRPLKDMYGHTPAASVGPLALKAIRERMVADGLSRNVVNQRVGRIRRAYKWGAENELVPVTCYQALATVRGLQPGRTNAREPEPVAPVSLAVVYDTLPVLSRHIRAMVEVQLLTGARPGEVCAMRAIDIDMTGRVWLYRPRQHKTRHRGRPRVIAVGPRAQAIIKPFLRADLSAYLFSPREARAEFDADRKAKRKTPMTPSQGRRTRRKNPKRSPGESYVTTSYTHAIGNAIERANKRDAEAAEREGRAPAPIPHWHPHQLRHTRATEVRRHYGLEAAQVVLGHARADVTQVYAERDLSLAEKIAREIG